MTHRPMHWPWLSGGVRTTDPINIKDPAVLRGMVVSIIIHENGGNPYAPAVIDEGVRRALACRYGRSASLAPAC